ncbi:hypothetical protein ASPACDRAFT_39710 [Aspergillus aculeatus ATCC 16872]|uniref:Uncharacterized protein n=1 Tax=Aspergillus aculeatus (strain ATCC 16872 / CBS 172.66 / WB 5094) TaxID=690307 RepID=A0A1L9X703_ASPA1|nr:uncharacterized protein ASPACDRAFT_39710 [Aspergillus aculeatus ATCC 16872]OJK04094.1 hypothetical protein ASPACDRAFT_39710 [Aspergillus aculeatus ATCC 16872]
MNSDNPSTVTRNIIRNPRRLLILSPSSHSTTIIPPLLHTLTGVPVTEPPSTPTTTTTTTALSSTTTLVASSAASTATVTSSAAAPPTTTSFAGYTTHPPLPIQNRYYTADIPIWVDEIPLSTTTSSSPSLSTTTTPLPPSPAQWKTEFSGPDAQVVRDAIGALLICVRNPVDYRHHHHHDPPSFLPDPASTPGTTTIPTTSEPEAAEDRADVRGLKEFIHAIGEVRGLIEEERGGLGVGEVPGLLVLVDASSSSPAGAGAAKGKMRGNGGGEVNGLHGELDDHLDAEIDEPFSVGWWEDQLCEMGLMGWEVVRWCPTGSGEEDEDEGRNRYGELQGMRRVKEVLETHDWSAAEEETEELAMGLGNDGDDNDDLERQLLGLDDENDGAAGFNFEVNELEREMVGLRMAIERGSDDYFVEEDEADEELRVDAVEALLLRMRAIKDMSDGLPKTERKRFAAKAVRDIMKEL